MTINGINGANTQMGQMRMNQATDAYSRNIQNQIAKAQKQLQELSSNDGLTLEEKMKKRQEIQQQISKLNMQLRQHQMEQRRAAQSRSEKQQAKVQGSVATGMKGKAGVLESEIKLDKVRGNDTQTKEEELAEVEQKAQAATTSQLSTLADASRTMEEAAQADSKTDNKDSGIKRKDAEENVSGTDAEEEKLNIADYV